MRKGVILFCAVLALSVMLSGCISENEDATASTPPQETYYLAIIVEGGPSYSIGLSEIKALSYEDFSATMVKKTGEEIETQWGGTSFYGFMDHVGVTGISEITLVALDGYEKTVEYAQLQQAMLAWKDENGDEISEVDGGPVRFVAPGLPSNTWIQNLTEIRVTLT